MRFWVSHKTPDEWMKIVQEGLLPAFEYAEHRQATDSTFRFLESHIFNVVSEVLATEEGIREKISPFWLEFDEASRELDLWVEPTPGRENSTMLLTLIGAKIGRREL